METDFFKFTTMALKEDINVFYTIFKKVNVLFDWANQKIASILLLQISLDKFWEV